MSVVIFVDWARSERMESRRIRSTAEMLADPQRRFLDACAKAGILNETIRVAEAIYAAPDTPELRAALGTA